MKRYDVLKVLTVSVRSEHDVVEVHKLQAFVFGLEALLSSLKTITFPLLYRVSQRSLRHYRQRVKTSCGKGLLPHSL